LTRFYLSPYLLFLFSRIKFDEFGLRGGRQAPLPSGGPPDFYPTNHSGEGLLRDKRNVGRPPLFSFFAKETRGPAQACTPSFLEFFPETLTDLSFS